MCVWFWVCRFYFMFLYGLILADLTVERYYIIMRRVLKCAFAYN